MTDLHGQFDSDLWRWTVRSGVAPGEAGLATAQLAEGAWVHVDAASGVVIEATFDAPTATGQLDGRVDEAFRAIDSRGASPAEVNLSAQSEAILSRLALLCEARDESSQVGPISDWWDAEALALYSLLDLIPPPGGPRVDGGRRNLPHLEVDGSESAEWHGRVEAVAGRLSGVVLGPTETVSRADLEALADPARARLGRFPSADGGRVALDPSQLPAGRLDLRGGSSVRFERERSAMTVTVPLQTGIYAAEVQDLIAVLMDEHDDVPVAVASFVPGPGLSAGEPVARAELVVGSQRSLESLSLQLTSRGTPIPSSALRNRRRALGAARVEAQRTRLATRPNQDLWGEGAFLGEVADAAALARGR